MKHKKLWILVLALVLVLSTGLAGCKPEVKKYRVSFAGEGISISAQEVEEGKCAEKPQDPVREGYTFDGWYLDDEPYAFTEAVTADITLTGKWIADEESIRHEVKFTGEGIEITSQQVEEGKTAQRPADPVREGYTFDGWYLDDELYTFTEAVTADITLTGKWIKDSTSGEGTRDDPLLISDGTGLTRLAELTEAGDPVYAELTADVQIPEGFAPIGSRTAPFKGSFDGKGFTVSGLNVSASLTSGLFGVTEAAVITDFTVQGTIVKGNFGGVIALAQDGTKVSLIRSELAVNAGIAGGIIGSANGSVTVEYCTASGDVAGTTAGGIVGSLGSGAIVNECVMSGITSGETGGGIVGEKKSDSAVYNSYAHGDVTASKAVGSVVGLAETNLLLSSNYIVNCYFNYDASHTYTGSDESVTVNHYGCMSAFVIAEDISWNAAYWNTSGEFPVLEAQDVTVPDTVTITFDGATVGGEAQTQLDYRTGFIGQPDSRDNAVFAGWYLDSYFSMPYNSGLPLAADATLYAAYADISLFERVWQSAQGTLDLAGDDYKVVGAQITANDKLINQAVILYAKGDSYFVASIDIEYGMLSWQSAADGSTLSYMADPSRFLGTWEYDTGYGVVYLSVSESYDEDGCLVCFWHGEPWASMSTRVKADGSVVLSDAGWTEFFFDEEGVLSYDYGWEIQKYRVAESAYAGEWLSRNGEVLVIDDQNKTASLDDASAPYTTESGEEGAVLKFTLGGKEYLFRYDSVKAIYISDSQTECIPYVYDAFIGNWTSGDLAHTYVIDENLDITVDGKKAEMSPSIESYDLVYSYTLDGKNYKLRLLNEVFLTLTEGTEEEGTEEQVLFNDELKNEFIGTYTDLINDYKIDEQFIITRSQSGVPDSRETAQGEFAYLDMDELGGIIVFTFAMDETLYVASFVMTDPCKCLMFLDAKGGTDQVGMYGFDVETKDILLEEFLLSEDVWSSGGKAPMEITVTNTGTVSIDGRDSNYMLSIDGTLGTMSLMFLDPHNENADLYILYEACVSTGTLYLSKMTAPAHDGVVVEEEDMLVEYTLIPSAEIAKFVGTYIYESDSGKEYVVYQEDGTCLISTEFTDEEGNSEVRLVEYQDIIFYSSVNAVDPGMNMYYLGFRVAEHKPEFAEDFYINVARFGNDVNYVSIMAINYVREDVFPFVGLLKGEDNSKIEISDTAKLKLNGESAEDLVYELQEDGTVEATFRLNAVIAPPGGTGHPEYEFKAKLYLDEATNAVVELTNLTTQETMRYSKFIVPIEEIAGAYEHGSEVIEFGIESVGAKSTLYVSVNDVRADAIDYEFDYDGNLVYVFTVGSNRYRVILVKDFFGGKTLQVTCTYTPKQDIPIPPPPPPPPVG